MAVSDYSQEVDFVRQSTDQPAPGGTAPGSAFAYADPSRAAAVMRSMAQDAAGVPRLSAERMADATLELVIERSNFLPACFLEVGARRAASVCQVKASGKNYKGLEGSWSGTGFLVSTNILLTNHHVLNSKEVAAGSMCIFNFQVDEEGKDLPTKGFRVNPDRLFLTSPVVDGLDFTFVWVDGDPGTEFGSVPLRRSSFSIVNDEYANIIQHPSGRPKAVVVQESQVKWQDAVVTHYTTDTEPGSSGSCVFNNEWRPVALHHASQPGKPGTNYKVLNEGIKLSAIAAWLDKLTDGPDASAAREVLTLFRGVDPAMGYFGALGRTYPEQTPGVEAVVDSFEGELADVDVAFWNVEWLARRYEEKAEETADVIARMNLDIWALEETSPPGTEAVLQALASKYHLQFEAAHSEPDASPNRQTTSVIWNPKTVKGKRVEWPKEIQPWFEVRSEDFDELGLEAIDGMVFNRYPGLFHFEAKRSKGQAPFSFYLVPLHLKAMDEGSKRRKMAARIIAAAVRHMQQSRKSKEDWVIGGDVNAELGSGDLDAMTKGGLVPVSAADERTGAMSYIKSPKSLIDHIFLSPNLITRRGGNDFFIVAAEKNFPEYVKKISDHRPVLVRLSLHDREQTASAKRRRTSASSVPDSLKKALGLTARTSKSSKLSKS